MNVPKTNPMYFIDLRADLIDPSKITMSEVNVDDPELQPIKLSDIDVEPSAVADNAMAVDDTSQAPPGSSEACTAGPPGSLGAASGTPVACTAGSPGSLGAAAGEPPGEQNNNYYYHYNGSSTVG